MKRKVILSIGCKFAMFQFHPSFIQLVQVSREVLAPHSNCRPGIWDLLFSSSSMACPGVPPHHTLPPAQCSEVWNWNSSPRHSRFGVGAWALCPKHLLCMFVLCAHPQLRECWSGCSSAIVSVLWHCRKHPLGTAGYSIHNHKPIHSLRHLLFLAPPQPPLNYQMLNRSISSKYFCCLFFLLAFRTPLRF